MTTKENLLLAEALESLESHTSFFGICVPKNTIDKKLLPPLLKSGHLAEVNLRYCLARKSPKPGVALTKAELEANYWEYLASYMKYNFGDSWAVSPEHSAALHLGDDSPPKIVTVRSRDGSGNLLDIAFGFSIRVLDNEVKEDIVETLPTGLQIHNVIGAVANISRQAYPKHANNINELMKQISDPADLADALENTKMTAENTSRTVKILREQGKSDMASKIEQLVSC